MTCAEAAEAAARLMGDLDNEMYKQGLSYRSVADTIGVVHESVSTMRKRKKYGPGLNIIIAIADALGLELVLVPKKGREHEQPYSRD